MQGQSPHRLLSNCTPNRKKAFWKWMASVPLLKRLRALLLGSSALVPNLAQAQSTSDKFSFISPHFSQYYSMSQMTLLAIFVGSMGFAILMALIIIKKRLSISAENQRLKANLLHLKNRIELADVLLQAPNQISILWARNELEPEIYGDIDQFEENGIAHKNIPAFGKWLKAESAKSMDDAVKTLRTRTKPFAITIQSKQNQTYEANGYVLAGRTIVHIKTLSKKHQESEALFDAHKALKQQFNALRHSFDRIESPIWQRNDQGQLIWVNQAYVSSVGAASRNDVLSNNVEIIPPEQEMAALKKTQERFQLTAKDKTQTIKLQALNLEDNSGTIFISEDISEQQSFGVTLKRNLENHSQILNQLNTAIAIFDGNQTLQFFNNAFCDLWKIKDHELQGEPDNTAVLNLLRSQDKLEPQPDWVKWKNTLLDAYKAQKTTEDIWQLPDNRLIKVSIHPNVHGGVSWIFEDISERINLESNFKSLTKVQHESFDSLKEGICVFGLDGRLKLHNPAFAKLWQFEPTQLEQHPHIAKIVEHCKTISLEGDDWDHLYTTVTGFKDQRTTEEGQISLQGDKHYHYALVPLPNGQAMLTFVNMTDSIRVEKVLTERNEALEAADRLKDNFIKHISYELRTPLTHIIGFSDLLESPISGNLNPKQHEYLSDIKGASSTLLAIVNDILDLVTVDAGVMSIEPQPVHFEDMVHDTLESVNERIDHHAYSLEIFDQCQHDPLMADRLRLKQILLHLISNAVQYSPPECTIHISLSDAQQDHCISVSDNGPGIPQNLHKTLFQRFESQTLTQGRGGAGLGLTIVKSLVELHGGRVEIEHLGHDGGTGTTVNCYFPKKSLTLDEAAE